MSPHQKHIVIVAGETSGDMRAAGLVAALKKEYPGLKFSGVGGDFMRTQGVELFEDITSLAVIGFVEVIKHFNRIKNVFNHVLREIDSRKPDAVILVDYPGFNLRLAKVLKSKGIKVIYYISPQVWAWREKRVLTIKQVVDRMIVLFPFEQEVYTKYGMKVDYVGHPLIDEVKPTVSKNDVLKRLGLKESHPTIGLLPGSREKELEHHLAIMLDAAQMLYDQDPSRQFILLQAPSVSQDFIQSQRSAHPQLPISIYKGNPYDAINAVDGAMVASGTATLETALLGKPLVVIYKTSLLTYLIAKAVIKIPYISLVNIVAGKKVVEELLQNAATAQNISQTLVLAMNNAQLPKELLRIKSLLGDPNASQRAARVVLEELQQK